MSEQNCKRCGRPKVDHDIYRPGQPLPPTGHPFEKSKPANRGRARVCGVMDETERQAEIARLEKTTRLKFTTKGWLVGES